MEEGTTSCVAVTPGNSSVSPYTVWVPCYLADPVAAACSMRAATGAGCDSMATWLDGSVMVSAWIALAMKRSASGGIMRSFAATMYQDGF